METNNNNNNNSNKVKLMISYGGKIHQRPHGHRLSYLGGDTKIISVDRHVTLSDIIAKLTLLYKSSLFALKYQLPGEDLDALVSVINDDDLENMLAEYERVQTISPTRLRLFLFPKPDPKPTLPNPDYLFGFDKEYNYDSPSSYPDLTRPESSNHISETEKNIKGDTNINPYEGHISTNGNYVVGPPMGQPVYFIPLTNGMPAVRFVCPDQPVYSYVAPMPATVATKTN